MNPHTVISVVVVLENDAAVVESLLDELSGHMREHFRFYEIVLVDDASNDGSWNVICSLLKKIQNVRYMRLSRCFGADVAMSAGVESAIGDYVVTMNPKYDPVTEVTQMVNLCMKSGGVVHGVAENAPIRSFARNFIGSLFRAYAKKQLGVEIKRGAEDFRVMSRQAVNALLQVREQSRYMRVLTLTLGFHQEWFTYQLVSRGGVERSGSWRSELAKTVDLLTSHTKHPLRLVSLVGLLGAGLNVIYALYVLWIYLASDSVAAGWTTLSLQQSGMFFLVCLILAVMSEYIGTILGEVRSRPLYFISQEANSSVLLEDTVHSSIVKVSHQEKQV
jgi:glycosyltransferase involved in cell wall biosynthesis